MPVQLCKGIKLFGMRGSVLIFVYIFAVLVYARVFGSVLQFEFQELPLIYACAIVQGCFSLPWAMQLQILCYA